MPGTVSDAPSVSLSFANNFWGKDDAGVSPLLERMHNSKVTCDELKAFYTARAAIEDEYARKLLGLARKPLGSSESGTLRMSLDVVRAEVESIAKAHQNVAGQMKSELDEQLSAFAGSMKERRKIVQNGIDKLLKTKTQQTMNVNKARDRYEQDCLKIKGYLAQGHMVMGQEERKNKVKLEKTQLQLSTTSNEYEGAIKSLEETTGRWNRDWKAACDKFQDLEEERIDFMKSSLWSFANIASTVCVSDDASCEKIRLSLEDCDVEKDIVTFIREAGTGQEIPDAPKFINFCKGDLNDNASDVSDDNNYSVAQFQRTMNPAFRSSSPQPVAIESQQDTKHDYDEEGIDYQDMLPESDLAASVTPKKAPANAFKEVDSQIPTASQTVIEEARQMNFPEVPHNEYPTDGMTQFCRIGPPSERSSVVSPVRPSSRDSESEYSNPTSFTSPETSSVGYQSPTKDKRSDVGTTLQSYEPEKKKSGVFQNRSPFRRKSKSDKDKLQQRSAEPVANGRNSWTPSNYQSPGSNTPRAQSTQLYDLPRQSSEISGSARHMSTSPEPTDPRANFQLNVGSNVFDVASPDKKVNTTQRPVSQIDDHDPIAQALADLKGFTKQSSIRTSADRYHGIGTPAPGQNGTTRGGSVGQPYNLSDRSIQNKSYNSRPPSYEVGSASRLGAPQPAHTSRQMQQTTQQYVDRTQDLFNSPNRFNHQDQHQQSRQRTTPQSRPGTLGQEARSQSRATSPVPIRSTSPRPDTSAYQHQRQGYSISQGPSRATSPSPFAAAGPPQTVNNQGGRPRSYTATPTKPRGEAYGVAPGFPGSSPGQNQAPRAVSPQPQFNSRPVQSEQPPLGRDGMTMQLFSPSGPSSTGYGPQCQPRGRPNMPQGGGRPASHYSPMNSPQGAPTGHVPDSRTRSRSTAGDGKQFSRDGRPIMQFSRSMYNYTAAIPEELSFAKGDILAVLRKQDDGWWEAELVGKRGSPGLVPSNYLQSC